MLISFSNSASVEDRVNDFSLVGRRGSNLGVGFESGKSGCNHGKRAADLEFPSRECDDFLIPMTVFDLRGGEQSCGKIGIADMPVSWGTLSFGSDVIFQTLFMSMELSMIGGPLMSNGWGKKKRHILRSNNIYLS